MADDFGISSRWFRYFHDAVFVSREQHTLQPLALVFVSVRFLCAVAHTRVRATIAHVQFSARNLIHRLPFLRTNRPPRRKKSILAKVGFDAKKGFVVNATKMYFYLIAPLFAPVFGLFVAKCSAICGKTQCILVLNTS